jgi:hypothetical protein
MKRDTCDVYLVAGTMYRASQDGITDAPEPSSLGFIHEMSGYTAAYDGLLNMEAVADRLCHESAKDDIRIRLVINGEPQPEAWLSEFPAVLDAWLEGGAQ